MENKDKAPLTDAEDKKIFFMCRKKFAPEDEKIDESTYCTSGYSNVDLFPYLVTMGYKSEKERVKVSNEMCATIAEKRKEYGLPPLVEAYSTQRLDYGTKEMSSEQVKKEWLMFTYGRGNGGLPVCWNNAGSMSDEAYSKFVNDKELAAKAKVYCVDMIEQMSRLKLKLSKEKGERITKHYAVLDVAKLGISNVNKLKGFIQNALGDAQVMYPETLQKQFIYNAGWVFRTIWAVVKLFIHPLTRAKIEILKDFKTLKKKLAEEGITEIPVEFGGDCKGAIYTGDNIYDAPDFKDPNAPKKEEAKEMEPAKKADEEKPAAAPGGGAAAEE